MKHFPLLLLSLCFTSQVFAQSSSENHNASIAEPSDSTVSPAPLKEKHFAEPKSGHQFALSFSPIHLIFPFVELTGELKIKNKLGIALVAGVGQLETMRTTPTGVTEDHFSAFEIGAQGRYYVVGDFNHGMQLGAEAMYLYVATDATDSFSASGSSLAIGPFVGYKLATRLGFTFEAQLGLLYAALQTEASMPGISSTAEQRTVLPLLNLNAGWSF